MLLSKLVADDVSVIDFGCGSGDAGVALQGLGFSRLAGLDTSSEKLKSAEKRQCYNQTIHHDLTLAGTGGAAFEAGICTNVMGFSEVGLEHLAVMLAMLKADAPLVLTVSNEMWESADWAVALDTAQTEDHFIVEYINTVPGPDKGRVVLIRNTAMEAEPGGH